jgi:hypothetical protein
MTWKKEAERICSFTFVFWWVFWLFNVIDKIIPGRIYLWTGKDRLWQFGGYFRSIGVSEAWVPKLFLLFVSVVEAAILIFLTIAIWNRFVSKNREGSFRWFFRAMWTALFIFSFFSIGDQIFGDRFELLEHTLLWISTMVSWIVCNVVEGRMK